MTSTLDPAISRALADAAQAQRSGNTALAERLYRVVLQETPMQPIALNALGMIALARGDATAVGFFQRATTADPAAGPLWMNLATAHRSKGDDAGERAALESALALDQRDLMANLRLAELLDRTGDAIGAVQRWQGIATMLQGIVERPVELDAVLTRARAAVAEHGRKVSDDVDTALAAARGEAEPGTLRRFDACVDAMLGRRAIFVNQPHGLRFPFLPADEFFERVHFPWMDEIDRAHDAVRGELEALISARHAAFRPYVEMAAGTPTNRWSALGNSLDWTAIYLWKYGTKDEDVCERCPATTALLERVPLAHIPGRGPTAFFSILRPGTRLPAHTGVTNVRAIVHLPLIVPSNCAFRVGGETRVWEVGRSFAFDDTIEHEAWNESDEMRAVLIFDVWNPHLTVTEQGLLHELFRVTGVSDSLSATNDLAH